jgi:iron complex transport system ATP-binding protein
MTRSSPSPSTPALVLDDVSLVRDTTTILDHVSWTILPGERWIVLGRNGCGKSTLLRIASLYLHPSSGSVTVLGETLGHTDVRVLRTRIGVAAASFADQLRPALTARDVVMTAKHAALEPWWHTYDDADRARAVELLERLQVGRLATHTFGTLSSGERQRVQLARTLMTDPGLLLLDEPTAGLDIAGREELVGALADLARDEAAPPMVLVTHHVEEIPAGFTHVLLMKEGRVFTAGPIADVLDADQLSACFDLPLILDRIDDRWYARSTS